VRFNKISEVFVAFLDAVAGSGGAVLDRASKFGGFRNAVKLSALVSEPLEICLPIEYLHIFSSAKPGCA
jgi:hypothetical protein